MYREAFCGNLWYGYLWEPEWHFSFKRNIDTHALTTGGLFADWQRVYSEEKGPRSYERARKSTGIKTQAHTCKPTGFCERATLWAVRRATLENQTPAEGWTALSLSLQSRVFCRWRVNINDTSCSSFSTSSFIPTEELMTDFRCIIHILNR